MPFFWPKFVYWVTNTTPSLSQVSSGQILLTSQSVCASCLVWLTLVLVGGFLFCVGEVKVDRSAYGADCASCVG